MSKQGADKEERAWNTPARGQRMPFAHLSCRAIFFASIQYPKRGLYTKHKKHTK